MQRVFQLSNLAVLEGGSLFCKYCGSHEVADAQWTDQHTKRRGIQQKLKIADMDLSGSLGKDTSSSLSYTTKFCKKCYNIHVADSSTIYSPVLIDSSPAVIFVVPYTLAVLLKTNQYTEEEILQLASDNREKLNRIQKKWSKKGQVPCKYGRMGYKIKLKLKSDIKIMCWIIVDTIRGRFAYRMSYGGAKVDCP
jgi:hypothetical protein